MTLLERLGRLPPKPPAKPEPVVPQWVKRAQERTLPGKALS